MCCPIVLVTETSLKYGQKKKKKSWVKFYLKSLPYHSSASEPFTSHVHRQRNISVWSSSTLICLFCPSRGLSSKESTLQWRWGLDPWIRMIPWRWKRQPTPILLPGESRGQGRLAGFFPWGHKSQTCLSHWADTHISISSALVSSSESW